MDGNGRWAEARGLPRSEGHKRGADTAKEVLETCGEIGIPHLTLYTFSSENWNRPENEVSDLMNLLRYYLENELENLHQNGVRLRCIGDHTMLEDDIRTMIERSEKLTGKNDRLNLNVALSYGSRQEIVHAVRELMKAKQPDTVDEETLATYLYTSDIPDPDLLIRTGGEQRLSNFLLWQSAYTELYFTDTLWPDFSGEDLKSAVSEFHRRERRYGLTPVQEASG